MFVFYVAMLAHIANHTGTVVGGHSKPFETVEACEQARLVQVGIAQAGNPSLPQADQYVSSACVPMMDSFDNPSSDDR